MKFSRRQLLQLTGAAAAVPILPRPLSALDYPVKPVRWISGYPAGGMDDILSRLMGQWLTERLGQPFIVENRPGANGLIAMEAVVRSPADGYTLHLTGTNRTIDATLYDKLSLNFIQDIAPVAGIIRVPFVMLVNPLLPAKTVPEFIAYAKANPGKINMASAGTGGPNHLSGELFKAMTGVNMVHVPYRGGAPAMTDLLSGQIEVFWVGMPIAIEYIRAGTLRALAVTTATRSEMAPDIPTVGEFLPGYEASAFLGVVAPRNTPTEIIDKLNKAINAAFVDPTMKERLAALGGTALPGTPAEFGKLFVDETGKWGKVIRENNIKVE
jgi:tripartite-type tricarboxylate transporter receptor subunit TctC